MEAQITIRIDESDDSRLRLVAEAHDRSKSQIVRLAAQHWLHNFDRATPADRTALLTQPIEDGDISQAELLAAASRLGLGVSVEVLRRELRGKEVVA